jgi:glycosyltransferase involved in cell wall biosynthesis
MKLLYVITKSNAGGAQTHVMQLARFFSSQGHDVTLMSRPGGWLEAEAHKLGVTYLANPHLLNTLNPIPLVRAGRVLKKALKDLRPDLVSCHSTIAGMIGRITIRQSIPTIFTAHGWGFAPRIREPRRTLVQFIERFLSRWTTQTICVSTYDLHLAKKTSINKAICIHNGVESFETAPQHTHRTEALFVGRLVPQKDPFILINAIHALDPNIRSQLHLSLIGSGPLEEDVRATILKQRLVNTITLIPSVPREDILKHMKQSDLFILTTHWEGLPRSILEAMAHGLPVIATDVGGVGDAITPQTGILISHGDQQALQEALTVLIKNPTQRQQMGRLAQHRARTQFSLEQMCQKTARVYEAVLK